MTSFWLICAILCQQAAPDRAATEKKVLEKINAYRKTLGFPPVAMDANFSKGCRLHAEYLVKNAGNPEAEGENAHTEKPELPGFTPEGQAAAEASDISSADPIDSVDAWVNSFFHRIPILNPSLQKVGFGFAKGENACASVLDIQRGVIPKAAWTDFCYPAHKQKNVPTTFEGGETPNPIPEDSDGRGGSPVTLTFREGIMVKEVAVSFKDADGKDVDSWISTPEKPALNQLFQLNTVCIIAKDPLKAGTTYTVSVTAKVSGKPWAKKWSFTTAEEKK